jgi:hypothetical protein
LKVTLLEHGVRRSLNGVVMSIVGHCHTIKTEFGRKHKINVKNSNISNGDNVHVLFDFTEDKIANIWGKDVAFPNDDAVQGKEKIEPPCIEDEVWSFSETVD